MSQETQTPEILVKIPISKQGKFRFKIRTSNLEFGDTFATRQKEITKNLYSEWQIGYDAVVVDVK